MHSKPVPLNSIFRCARPVLFATGDMDYPISIRGTGFIVRFRKKYFAVTASHVTQGFDLSQVRFQYHPNSSTFIPLIQPFFIHGDDPEDTDQYDIVAFSIDDSMLDFSMLKDYPPYELLERYTITLFDRKAAYAFQGYPTEQRECQYDEKRVDMKSVLYDAVYEGASTSQLLHTLHVNRANEINNFDGLSGAPVFQINHTDEYMSQQAFVGMLLRGTARSGKVEFLERSRIIDVLTKIINGEID